MSLVQICKGHHSHWNKRGRGYKLKARQILLYIANLIISLCDCVNRLGILYSQLYNFVNFVAGRVAESAK